MIQSFSDLLVTLSIIFTLWGIQGNLNGILKELKKISKEENKND